MAGSLEPWRYSKRGQVDLIVKIILVYIDGPPLRPFLYCTQEQYSSLMNPPKVSFCAVTISDNVTLAVCYSGEKD